LIFEDDVTRATNCELILALLTSVRAFFRSRSETALEILALRQQIVVLKTLLADRKLLLKFGHSSAAWPKRMRPPPTIQGYVGDRDVGDDTPQHIIVISNHDSMSHRNCPLKLVHLRVDQIQGSKPVNDCCTHNDPGEPFVLCRHDIQGRAAVFRIIASYAAMQSFQSVRSSASEDENFQFLSALSISSGKRRSCSLYWNTADRDLRCRSSETCNPQ
jgi:hypothetical protein